MKHLSGHMRLPRVRLSNGGGFSRAEIRKIEALVIGNRQKLMEAWNEFFGY